MNYIKNYMKHYRIGIDDIVLCKVCGQVSVDLHHIVYRSQGGGDGVDNLIPLCRKHHEDAHKKILTKEYLQSLCTK